LRFHPKVVFLFCENKNNNMGKDSKKHLVGQPVFKQIIEMIPKEKFDLLVKKTKAIDTVNRSVHGTSW